MTAYQLDSRDLVKSLRSDVCPACGGTKATGHSVCYRRCWKKLPRELKARLYQRVGEGYEEAFAAAMHALGAAELQLRPRPQPKRGGQAS